MKVLVVDDNAGSRELLQLTLEMTDNIESRICNDGNEGLEAFQDFEPDVIISDIDMPNMNGLEMLKEIRKISDDAIVIMITAYGKNDYAIQALRYGANNYLLKPFQPEELQALLRKYQDVTEERIQQSEILDMIVERDMVILLESRVNLIPGITQLLLAETGYRVPREDQLGIRLGLEELLINSVEHGNLSITYEEKSNALALNPEGLHQLYKQRRQNPVYGNRKVTIHFKMNREYCQWLISDEGEGFDWENIPNPLEDTALKAAHGRGIFLSRFQFDEMEYLGKGNQVRVRKNLFPRK